MPICKKCKVNQVPHRNHHCRPCRPKCRKCGVIITGHQVHCYDCAPKREPTKEWTEKELDQMIAEQYQCLPDWWNNEDSDAED